MFDKDKTGQFLQSLGPLHTEIDQRLKITYKFQDKFPELSQPPIFFVAGAMKFCFRKENKKKHHIHPRHIGMSPGKTPTQWPVSRRM